MPAGGQRARATSPARVQAPPPPGSAGFHPGRTAARHPAGPTLNA